MNIQLQMPKLSLNHDCLVLSDTCLKIVDSIFNHDTRPILILSIGNIIDIFVGFRLFLILIYIQFNLINWIMFLFK